MDDQNTISPASNLQIPEEAKKALLEEMGIADLPEDQQNELIGKMTEAVLKRILLEVLEKLNENDKAAYEKMIDDQASSEEMEKFLQEKIPDYDKLVEKVVNEFKDEMKKEL